MERVPERELMDDPEQARVYAEADFDEPNGRFCDLVESRLSELPDHARVLDLGCGPLAIGCELATRRSGWTFVGVDGSPAMLTHARQNIAQRNLGDRVTLVCGRIPEVDLGGPFDVILSNSLLHHLPDPAPLWTTIAAWARPGAAVAVMDLARPASRDEAARLVDTHSPHEPPLLRRDFFNSLLAAFTVEEVVEQLSQAGLDPLEVERVSDRHLFVWGTRPARCSGSGGLPHDRVGERG